MEEFPREALEFLIDRFANAPDSQMSKELQEECRNFDLSKKTDLEVYEFMDYLSKQPLTEISSFVQTACDISKYYKKPE